MEVKKAMSNKQNRQYIPELKKFIEEKGREYLNLIAYKMGVSERTLYRWYKQESRPSKTERSILLRIIRGYNAPKRKRVR